MGILSNEYKQMLLSLTPDDITAEFIYAYLADTAKKDNGKFVTVPSRIKTYDTFELKKDEYFNTENITTNVGLFIFNKFIIEESLTHVTGYINEPINQSVQKKFEGKISKALLEDRIKVSDMVTYLNKLQWLTMQFNNIFSGSLTLKTIKPLPKVMKAKEKLLKENKELLEKGDMAPAVRIENELINIAKEELKGDPGMDLYDSGARGSFSNNYKNIAIAKGPVYNPVTNKWDFVASSFMEGIQKNEIPIVANSVPAGALNYRVGHPKSF